MPSGHKNSFPEMSRSKNQDSNHALRVLFVLLSLGVGGAEKLVYDMIQELSPQDVTSVVCCLDMIGPLGEKLIDRGITVYGLKRRKGIDWGLVYRLHRIIAQEGVDVVHAHQYTPYFYGALSSFLFRDVKLIFTEHGRLYPDRRRLKRYLFNPLLARRTDHIVSISENTKKAMVRYDNFPARRVEVIHNGVRLENNVTEIDPSVKRRSLGLDGTSRIVGTAARLDSIKNIPMLLNSFRIVLEKMPDTYLLIAGKGPERENLESISERSGIKDRVLFLGLRYDLPEIYPLFDVFALTSFTEGISITLLEAMAAGIPSVVTDVGGNSEVVVNGETGYLVPLGEEELMADRILTLLKSPEKRNDMGAHAAERVRTHFSFQRMISSYLHLYQGRR